MLKVKGHKNVEGEITGKESYILEEFDYESFERCFRLSPEIAKDEVLATCENGILHLTFQEVSKPTAKKKITVSIA